MPPPGQAAAAEKGAAEISGIDQSGPGGIELRHKRVGRAVEGRVDGPGVVGKSIDCVSPVT